MSGEVLSTRQKALKINLDPRIYGTLAEIGAGQEVSRFFFQAGGASGTIAKTMSAYDKIFSDVVYGKETNGRYVSEARLLKMLDKEFTVLEERLTGIRPENNLFFAFANTVSAINFYGTNESHGWLGIRYQLEPKGEPVDVVIHVRMLDQENISQQHAVGVIGVNLIYAAFFYSHDPEFFIESLMDGLSTKRIEINMVRFTGKWFKDADNRILNLKLVRKGYTSAVMFNEKGEIILASDELYKQNILVVRGSYRPPTLVSSDILKTGLDSYVEATGHDPKKVNVICELTMTNLSEKGAISRADFLARVDLLSSLGFKVLISNYHQYFKLTEYFSKFKCPNLGIVLGIFNFQQIFDHDYNNFDASALQSLGINMDEDEEGEELNVFASIGLLFRPNVSVYVYPYHSKDENICLDNLKVSPQQKHLINFLRESHQLFDIKNVDESICDIYSRKVLEMIENGQEGWEKMVPKSVATTIKKKKLFGYGA